MVPTPDTLRRNAREIVDAVLRDYGGPCSQAYADLLRAYIAAPAGGRDALFLEVAYRAFGEFKAETEVNQSSPDPCPDSPATSAPAQPLETDPLADFVHSTLALIQSLQTQSRS